MESRYTDFFTLWGPSHSLLDQTDFKSSGVFNRQPNYFLTNIDTRMNSTTKLCFSKINTKTFRFRNPSIHQR